MFPRAQRGSCVLDIDGEVGKAAPGVAIRNIPSDFQKALAPGVGTTQQGEGGRQGIDWSKRIDYQG
jgi:hypothetical protein